MGIRFLADPAHQLPMLVFKGKAWRIGLMGETATERNGRRFADALRNVTASGRTSP